jgi:drug/metabolite transporter (DMT)-like permease
VTPAALVLIVLSAGLHATWNLLSKRRQPSSGYFLLANAAGVVLLCPAVYANRAVLLHLNGPIVGLLVAAGLCQATYYGGLARAYRAGDMSVAYPLARSSPVLMVTAATMVLGRGHEVSTQCLVGMGLVVCGCFLIPLRGLAAVRLKDYLNPTCGFALVAACGTAGSSLIDDQALRQLRATPALAAAGVTGLTLVYACLEGVSSTVWLIGLSVFRPDARQQIRTYLRADRLGFVVAGAMIYATYSMVLVAMAYVTNVSYLVAFRQLSIPLGALLGVTLLGEPAHRPKLAGVIVVSMGLLLVGTG